MRIEKHTSIIEFAVYTELDVVRQKEIYDQALKDNRFYDQYATTMWDDYLFLLNDIQKEHDLDIEPIFSQGSQHYLYGFKSVQRKDSSSYILFKGVEFDFNYDIGYLRDKTKNKSVVVLGFYEEENDENLQLRQELISKIEAFVSDFMKMYGNYIEHFMYGYCDDYERYVQDELTYGDVEYEKIVDLHIKKIKGE